MGRCLSVLFWHKKKYWFNGYWRNNNLSMFEEHRWVIELLDKQFLELKMQCFFTFFKVLRPYYFAVKAECFKNQKHAFMAVVSLSLLLHTSPGTIRWEQSMSMALRHFTSSHKSNNVIYIWIPAGRNQPQMSEKLSPSDRPQCDDFLTVVCGVKQQLGVWPGGSCFLFGLPAVLEISLF